MNILASLMQWLPWVGVALGASVFVANIYRAFLAKRAVDHFSIILKRDAVAKAFSSKVDTLTVGELDRLIEEATHVASIKLERKERDLALAGLKQSSEKGRKLYLKSLLTDDEDNLHAAAGG
ncbi:MAG: hypothetical protein ACLPXB_06725 [Thiobacillaceae bacterium]